MASEIQADYLTGKTLYAEIRNSVGQIWNTTALAFQAYVTANITDYDIAMTEQGTASGYYVGDLPTLSAGVYNIVVKQKAGVSPAESDLTTNSGYIEWDGTTVIALSTRATPAQVWSNSTRSLTDKDGFKLASDGLDSIVVEVGLNARQVLAILAAAESGNVTVSGNVITIEAANNAGTIRITANGDVNGNRSSLVLTPPA